MWWATVITLANVSAHNLRSRSGLYPADSGQIHLARCEGCRV